jgi:UDP-N-acetylmuramyl pentapeptide synthase
MWRARSPGDPAPATSRVGARWHRVGFAVLDARERLSPYVRWPLHAIARRHRRRHPDVPLVPITGSTGKTTTQALVAHVLANRFAVVATPVEENTDLTFHREILRTRSGANQVLVLECGIQRPGNGDRWNQAIDPDVLVLTNVGDTHLAWLGSREGVLAEKLELARNLKPGGWVVVNATTRCSRPPPSAVASSGSRCTPTRTSSPATWPRARPACR